MTMMMAGRAGATKLTIRQPAIQDRSIARVRQRVMPASIGGRVQE
jgi:hypothetical protein